MLVPSAQDTVMAEVIGRGIAAASEGDRFFVILGTGHCDYRCAEYLTFKVN